MSTDCWCRACLFSVSVSHCWRRLFSWSCCSCWRWMALRSSAIALVVGSAFGGTLRD